MTGAIVIPFSLLGITQLDCVTLECPRWAPEDLDRTIDEGEAEPVGGRTFPQERRADARREESRDMVVKRSSTMMVAAVGVTSLMAAFGGSSQQLAAQAQGATALGAFVLPTGRGGAPLYDSALDF